MFHTEYGKYEKVTLYLYKIYNFIKQENFNLNWIESLNYYYHYVEINIFHLTVYSTSVYFVLET